MKLYRATITNLAITLLLVSSAHSQTTLNAGDIAIVGYNYDASPQEMSIVTLVPIETGTRIFIADYGYEAGAFVANTLANNFEGSIEWLTTASIAGGTVFRIQFAAANAGTVVTGLPGTVTVRGWKQEFTSANVTTANTPSAAGGESWFIYQGTAYNSPTQFVFGWANWASTTFGSANGWVVSPQTVGTNVQVSQLPTQLSNGVNARSLSWFVANGGNHGDNNLYNGITTGSRADLLAAICDVANWQTDETTTYDISPGGSNFSGVAPQFTITGSTLPVSWETFTAMLQHQDLLLKWTTQSEPDNRYFTVQHSVDGSSWTDLGELAAQGREAAGSSYQFLHRSPGIGMHYYRLRQTDIDGRFTYSSILTATVPSSMGLRVYPNPGRKQVTISTGNSITLLQLRLYNSSGQLIKNISNARLSGGQYQLDTSQLPVGWYLIQVLTHDRAETIRLTIEP